MLRSLWRNLLRRRRAEHALDAELRAYIDLLAAEHERNGKSPQAARRAALIESGGIERVKELSRDSWTGNVVVVAVRDVHHSLRSLGRTPVFVAVAIATLGVGIGGATAVFTVVNGVLLTPLAGVVDPDSLVTVERDQNGRAIAEFSFPDYRDLRDNATSLAGLAAFNGTSMELEDAAGSIDTWVSYVSDDFFSVLGVRAAAGRVFTAEQLTARGADHDVIVLGYSLWQSRYGGEDSAIGSTVTLEGHPFTIIGVAPEDFVGAMARYHMDAWIPVLTSNGVSPPLAGHLDPSSRRIGWLRLVGRLAEGRTIDEAREELAGIAARLESAYPTNRGRGVTVLAGAGMTAEERVEMSRVPKLLGLASAGMLLIACGNVAGLSVARAAARRRELATRVALGASQAVVVRQVAIEGAVISASAGALGIGLSRALVESGSLVETLVSIGNVDLGIDFRVLGMALAVSTLTAVLITLLPALQVFRVPAGAVLKDGGRGSLRRQRGQRLLVAAQVGASLVLLATSTIIFSALQRTMTGYEGLDPQELVTVDLDDAADDADPRRRLSFYRALIGHSASHPEIDGAAVASTVPPFFSWAGSAPVFRRGEEPPPGELIGREFELGVRANVVVVSEGLFDLMRIPLLRGRAFAPSDDDRSPPVVIVGRRLAEELWPAQDPIGRYLAWPAAEGPARAPLLVVGVARDMLDVVSGAMPLAMYVPFAQQPNADPFLLLRSRPGTAISSETLRRLVAEVDPGVAVQSSPTLYGRMRSEVYPERVATMWIGAFGAIALLLAGTGLYAVVAQSVLQRRREFAVRSALGASPGGIVAGVIGDGMWLAGWGGLAGALGALVAFWILRSVFTGVAAADLMPVIAAAGALAVAMLAATYLPARHLTRLDVADTMRSE